MGSLALVLAIAVWSIEPVLLSVSLGVAGLLLVTAGYSMGRVQRSWRIQLLVAVGTLAFLLVAW